MTIIEQWNVSNDASVQTVWFPHSISRTIDLGWKLALNRLCQQIFIPNKISISNAWCKLNEQKKKIKNTFESKCYSFRFIYHRIKEVIEYSLRYFLFCENHPFFFHLNLWFDGSGVVVRVYGFTSKRCTAQRRQRKKNNVQLKSFSSEHCNRNGFHGFIDPHQSICERCNRLITLIDVSIYSSFVVVLFVIKFIIENRRKTSLALLTNRIEQNQKKNTPCKH